VIDRAGGLCPQPPVRYRPRPGFDRSALISSIVVGGLIAEYALGLAVFLVAFLALRPVRVTEGRISFRVRIRSGRRRLLVSGSRFVVSTFAIGFVLFPSYVDRYTLPFTLPPRCYLRCCCSVWIRDATARCTGLVPIFSGAGTGGAIRQECGSSVSFFWQTSGEPRAEAGHRHTLDGIPKPCFTSTYGMLECTVRDNPSETPGYYIFTWPYNQQPNLSRAVADSMGAANTSFMADRNVFVTYLSSEMRAVHD